MPSFSSRDSSGTPYPIGPAYGVDILPPAAPEEQLVTPELLKTLKQMQPGDHALNRHFVPAIPEMITSAQFIDIENFSLTREESVHAVRFGQLMLNTADEGEHSLHVGIKPFDSPREAAHEYAVASYFADGKSKGFDTFKPLGMYKFTDKNQWGIISNYEHSVRSLDTIFWNPELIEDKQVIAKALGHSALTLKSIHEIGWTHGDARVRNIAWNVLNPQGMTKLIDVEYMNPFPREDGNIKTEEARSKIVHDLREFIGSLYLIDPKQEFDSWVREHFCLVYAGNGNAQRWSEKFPELPPITYDELSGMIDQEKQLVPPI